MEFQAALDKALERGSCIQLPDVTPILFVTKGVTLLPKTVKEMCGINQPMKLAPMVCTMKKGVLTPFTLPTESVLSLGWKVVRMDRGDEPLIGGLRIGEVALRADQIEELYHAVEYIGNGNVVSVSDTHDPDVKIARLSGDFFPDIDEDDDVPRYTLSVDELAGTITATLAKE